MCTSFKLDPDIVSQLNCFNWTVEMWFAHRIRFCLWAFRWHIIPCCHFPKVSNKKLYETSEIRLLEMNYSWFWAKCCLRVAICVIYNLESSTSGERTGPIYIKLDGGRKNSNSETRPPRCGSETSSAMSTADFKPTTFLIAAGVHGLRNPNLISTKISKTRTFGVGRDQSV